MRGRIVAIGLLQAALLVACDHPARNSQAVRRDRNEGALERPVSAIPLGSADQAKSAEPQAPAGAPLEQWFGSGAGDPLSRLIIRTGQASIEVDSLEPAMAELRRIVQRVGGFVADASVQSGRHQIRTATLQLKVPSSRFDELTERLEPLGRLQYVTVGAQDVSEEFVDLTARVANGRRLEDRLVELLRTRTGKLSDVLTVERELARVREEIERMEGRMRFLKTNAELSTLAVSLSEPAPIVATPGRNPIADAFKTAWRNFVGVLAGAIASLGFVVPVVVLGWGTLSVARKYRRKPA